MWRYMKSCSSPGTGRQQGEHRFEDEDLGGHGPKTG